MVLGKLAQTMSEYEQFLGVILLTVGAIVIVGLLLSVLVVAFIGLRGLWRMEHDHE